MDETQVEKKEALVAEKPEDVKISEILAKMSERVMSTVEMKQGRFVALVGVIMLILAFVMKILSVAISSSGGSSFTPLEFISCIIISAAIIFAGTYFQDKTAGKVIEAEKTVLKARMGLIDKSKSSDN